LELGVGALQLVGFSREVVVRALEFRFRFLARGDVRADAAVAGEAAARVEDRLAAHRDPARAAGRVLALHLELAERLLARALLDSHVVDLAVVELLALLVDDVEILGMRDLPPGHADQLVLRIAEDLAQAAVDADELAVEADVRDPRAGELEGAPVALLALAQRR